MPVYSITPSGNDQTSEIQALLKAGGVIDFAPGTYKISYIARSDGEELSFLVKNKDNITINGNGAKLVYYWDNQNIDATLRDIFRFVNCDNLSISGITIDFSERLFAQGYCTARTGDQYFDFTVDQGFRFFWETGDFLGSVNSVTGQFQETQYEVDDDKDRTPFTIENIRDGQGNRTKVYRVTPSNPPPGEPRVPDWVEPGVRMYLLVRKRAGNPFGFVRCGALNLTIEMRGAAAVGIKGNELVNPTINVLAQSDGLIAGNAGCLVLLDVRGTFRSTSFETYGLCDDNINIRTRLWDRQILEYTVFRQITAEFNISDRPNVFPAPPRVGDKIEFWDPEGILNKTVTATAVTKTSAVSRNPGSTAVYEVALDKVVPPLYVPSTEGMDAWLTLNRTMVPRWRMGTVRQVGGIRTIFAQSHDWSIETLYSENIRATNIRHGFPASDVHETYGGAKGGGHIGTMTVRNSVFRYTPDSNSVVNVRMLKSTGGNAEVNQGFPPIVIDRLEVDGCGYGVAYAGCMDLQIGSRTMANTGTLRTGDDPAGPNLPGGNDDYAAHATLTILSDAPYGPYKSLTGAGGIINRTVS